MQPDFDGNISVSDIVKMLIKITVSRTAFVCNFSTKFRHDPHNALHHRNYLKSDAVAALLEAVTKDFPSLSSTITNFPLTVFSHSVKLYLT
jgi:hypothetical protein